MDCLDDLEYLKVKHKGSYCSIHSPKLEAGPKDFATKRAILNEFKKLENLLKDK